MFIHSSIDGYFHILVTVNNAAMNIWTLGRIYIFELVFLFSLEKYPEVELLDHMAVLFLIFWGTSILFSIVATSVCISVNSAWRFPFLHILAHSYFFGLLDDNHSDSWEVISHCGFWFAFPWWLAVLSLFSCACWTSACLLWKSFYSGPLPIFNWIVFLLLYEFFVYFEF